MPTARLMITKNCLRQCGYCHNKSKTFTDSAVALTSLYPMKHYDKIVLTGGEMMEDPRRTKKIIEIIKGFNPTAKIYLHTARYSVEMIVMMDMVDGITFHLHEGAGTIELIQFNKFQMLVNRFPGKSYRLYMHPSVKVRIPVKPSLWNGIVSKAYPRAPKVPQGSTHYKLVILPD